MKSNVYPTQLKIELEAAASLDLKDLAIEISMLSEEHLPALRKAIEAPSESQGAWISSLMAIAFEAGFQCGIRDAIATVSAPDPTQIV